MFFGRNADSLTMWGQEIYSFPYRRWVKRTQCQACAHPSFHKQILILLSLALIILLTSIPQQLFADTAPSQEKDSGSLFGSMQKEELKRQVRLRFAPVELQGGGSLTLVSPEEWAPVAERVSSALLRIHNFFADVFGPLPAFTTTLRLMDEQSFYELTGAPGWTNAMFYRGQIIIPLDGDLDAYEMDNLYRSLRHEYTHAVIHALSKGRCPGWLDEGIAQWIEGEENPALVPALRAWLRDRSPVTLNNLQGGFTVLQSEVVPVAYAQSLFMAQELITDSGFDHIRAYLNNLALGESPSTSFQNAFGVTLSAYEKNSAQKMHKWRESSASRILSARAN
jgi:hypothetical protein